MPPIVRKLSLCLARCRPDHIREKPVGDCHFSLRRGKIATSEISYLHIHSSKTKRIAYPTYVALLSVVLN